MNNAPHGNHTMTTKEHLSQAEYKDFQSRRTRVVVGFCAALSYALLLAVLKHTLHVEPNLALLLACGFAIGIWVLLQLFGFKCPRCGTIPMMTRTSFGTGNAAVTGFVALRPKKCLKCGVRFTRPQEGEQP